MRAKKKVWIFLKLINNYKSDFYQKGKEGKFWARELKYRKCRKEALLALL